MSFGFDPATAALLLPIASNLFSSIFGGGSSAPAGPTAAQIAAEMERQRQAASSKSTLLIGVGLAGVGVLAAILLLGRTKKNPRRR